MNWKILKYNLGLMITLSGILWGLEQNPEVRKDVERSVASILPIDLGEDDLLEPEDSKDIKAKSVVLGKAEKNKNTKEEKKEEDKKEEKKKKRAALKKNTPLNKNIAYYPDTVSLGRSPSLIKEETIRHFSNQGITSASSSSNSSTSNNRTEDSATKNYPHTEKPIIYGLNDIIIKTTEEVTTHFSLSSSNESIFCEDLLITIDSDVFLGNDLLLSGGDSQNCSLKIRTSFNPSEASPVSISYQNQVLKSFKVNFIPVTSLEVFLPEEIPKGLKFPLSVKAKFADHSFEDVSKKINIDFDANIFLAHEIDSKLEAINIGEDELIISFKEEEFSKPIKVLSHSGLETLNPYLKAGSGLIYKNQVYTTLSNGKRFDLTNFIPWEISNDDVAGVTNGEIKLIQPGLANIDLYFDGFSSKAVVEVTNTTLDTLKINGLSNLTPWAETTYQAVAYFNDGTSLDVTEGVSWSVSEPHILSLNKNKVVALSDGMASLHIKAGDLSTQKDVNVAYAEAISIHLEPELAILGQNQKLKYKVFATYSNGAIHEVSSQSTWFSTNSLVAISNGVASSGNISSFSEVSVQAYFKGLSTATKLTLTPSVIQSIYTYPEVNAIRPGDRVDFKVYGILSDRGLIDLTEYATFEALTPSISTTPTPGQVVALSLGSAQLKVKAQEKDFTTSFTVSHVNNISYPGLGLNVQYFSGNDFNTLKGQRVETHIDFLLGDADISPVGEQDYFSVRRLGFLKFPVSGNVFICTDSDDGIKVKLNNTVIIDNWSIHPDTRDCSPAISVNSGQKLPIEVGYFEYTGASTTKIYWGSSLDAMEPIPQSAFSPN